ncbi:hypothetical protein JHK85_051518 [Glycine max]|nr:hypothetical protein JHK85_051518 [Glycine max]
MDHWYLMVIDLPGKKLFHLDCDLTSQTAYDRKDTTKIMLDEKAVRMKVAMILLLGTHNQYKGELIRNAERTWHDSIHGKH